MASDSPSFFSFLCRGCFSHKEEAKTEAIITPGKLVRNRSQSKGSTILTPMKPLKITKVSPNLIDSADLKTAVSYKEHGEALIESKSYVHAETATSTPRFDLELEVIESDYLASHQKMKLNSEGFINSIKTKHARRFYFGTEKSEHSEAKNDEVDIICSKYKLGCPVQTARLSYDGDYYLKDLGGGDGVYIRADDKMELVNSSIVHYGIGHFIVQSYKDKVTKENLLKLTFMDGPHEGQERIIKSDEACTFGRLNTCTVVFDEYGVSRIQCKIFYQDGRWFIKDGDGFKKSTNGTWLLLQDKQLVFNRMVFKVCNSVFRAHIVDI